VKFPCRSGSPHGVRGVRQPGADAEVAVALLPPGVTCPATGATAQVTTIAAAARPVKAVTRWYMKTLLRIQTPR
jgi:hypothetical protein